MRLEEKGIIEKKGECSFSLFGDGGKKTYSQNLEILHNKPYQYRALEDTPSFTTIF
jgi:hypothetical protein